MNDLQLDILAELDRGPLGYDQLARRVNATEDDVIEALLPLDLERLTRRLPGQRHERYRH